MRMPASTVVRGCGNDYVVFDGSAITVGSSFIACATAAKRGSVRIGSKIGALIDIA